MSVNTIQKSYNSVAELPTQVTSALDTTDAEKWMNTYNEAIGNKSSPNAVRDAKEKAWMSVVDAPSSLAVETWASVEVRDADGELVPVKTITENLDKFIESGGLMHDSHSNVPVGSVWGWEEREHPETGQDGVVVYFNINRGGEVFERAREDILTGRKQAVSIGAEAPRGGYKCDERGCYVERDVTDLYEISICETPANPEAYFINVGKDIAKSHYDGEVLRLHVKADDIHESYDTCPLQKKKYDIRKALPGYEVHMDDYGVITVKGTFEAHILDTLMKMKGKDDYIRYDIRKSEFEFIPGYLPEDAVKEAIDNEWACTDAVGHTLLTRKIPADVFKDWYDRSFLKKVGDLWCISTDDVAKESGSMGVGDAGAVNAVYGKKVSEANRITGNDTTTDKKVKFMKKSMDMNAVISDFNKAYYALYALDEITDGTYMTLIDVGDTYISRFKQFLWKFNEARGDTLTSDREVAAFAVVASKYYDEMTRLENESNKSVRKSKIMKSGEFVSCSIAINGNAHEFDDTSKAEAYLGNYIADRLMEEIDNPSDDCLEFMRANGIGTEDRRHSMIGPLSARIADEIIYDMMNNLGNVQGEPLDDGTIEYMTSWEYDIDTNFIGDIMYEEIYRE